MASDSKTLELFNKRFEQAKTAHALRANKWRHFEEVYEGTSHPEPSRETRHRSRVFVKWAYQQVEVLKPRLIDPEPVFVYRPVDPSDEKNTKILDKVVKYQLDQNGFIEKQTDFIHDAMVKGFTVAKVVWAHETRKIRKRRKRTVMDLITKADPIVEHEAVVKNWPAIIYVDPYDFFWDPAATSEEDWRWVFHRSYVTLNYLKQREAEGIYTGVKDLEDCLDAEAEQERGAAETPEEARARRSERVELVEMFENDRILVVANGKVILRDEPNPNWHGRIPFVTMCSQPRPNSLVGISEVETIEPIQEHLWTIRNLRIDAVKMAIHKMLILDPTIKNANDIVWRMGGKIFAGPGQRVEWIDMDPHTAPSLEEEQMALTDMQTITGADPFLAGQAAQATDTATGASIQQEEANKRMAMKKMQFRIFTSKLAKLMVQLNYQYMDDDYRIRIVGPEGESFQSVSPNDIPLLLDVRPVGLNESISKSVERNSVLEIMNVLGPMSGAPMGDGTKVNIKPLIERLVKTYDMSPDEFFPAMNQMEQMMAMGMDPNAMMQQGAIPPEQSAPPMDPQAPAQVAGEENQQAGMEMALPTEMGDVGAIQ